MKKLIDTSILHGALITGHTEHRYCREVMREVQQEKFTGIIVINSLLELFASITNPSRTDPPVNPQEALQYIKSYTELENVEIFSPEKSDYERALELSSSLNLIRTKVFDGLLLVAGQRAGAEAAITLNKKDFEKFNLMPIESP